MPEASPLSILSPPNRWLMLFLLVICNFQPGHNVDKWQICLCSDVRYCMKKKPQRDSDHDVVI